MTIQKKLLLNFKIHTFKQFFSECDEEHPCQGLGEHAHFRSFGMAFLVIYNINILSFKCWFSWEFLLIIQKFTKKHLFIVFTKL